MSLNVDLILWYRYRGKLALDDPPAHVLAQARELAPFDLRTEIQALLIADDRLAELAAADVPEFVRIAKVAWRKLTDNPILGTKSEQWKPDWLSPLESVDTGGDTWEPPCNADGCHGIRGMSFPWQRVDDPVSSFAHRTKKTNVLELADGWEAEVYLQFLRPASLLDRALACKRTFSNPLDVPAVGLALLFADARTLLLNVEHDDRDATVLGSPLLRSILFPTPILPTRPVDVTISSLGDPPYLRQAIWLTAQRDEPRPAWPPQQRWPLRLLSELPQLARSFGETLALREESVAQQTSDVTARQFFLHMDTATMPEQVQDPLTKQRIESLALYLQNRWRRRAHVYADTGEAATFDAKEIHSRKAQAITAADLLKPHFEVFGSGDQLVQGAAEAFARFAGGALREIETHGVPNGVYYFSFGELALLLQELDYDQAFWGPLTAPLCRTAEIFVNAFHTPNAPRASCAYTAENNRDGERAYDDSRIQQLEMQWSKTDVAWQFSRLVATALSAEVGPVTNPYPLG
ncbi:MAG: hypothetical protein H6834_15620 [Planctomycetes bacterium]|nr:hypothetical protein [Planctomycetota bacterium]